MGRIHCPMSIATKKGDNGTTGLMYNRRVPKDNPRTDCYGTYDEVNAAIGVARAHNIETFVLVKLSKIQDDLIHIMGELATHPDDMEKFDKDGYRRIGQAELGQIDKWVKEVEDTKPSTRGWATPGSNIPAAHLDYAVRVIRRVERLTVALSRTEKGLNPILIPYINRTADLVWLLARWVETDHINRGENNG